MKFQIGDKVRATAKVPSAYWWKPGMEGEVVTDSGYGYNVRFKECADGAPGHNWGFALPEHIEVIATGPAPTVASDLRLTPQARTVLAHLKKRPHITPAEALTVYGISRLASCIHEIRRKAGYGVVMTVCRDDVGHKYAKYAMAPQAVMA